MFSRIPYLVNMDNVVPSIDESHITISAFVLFLSKMAGNMPIQILLRIESSSTRDTFEIFGQILMNYCMIIKGFFPFECLGTNIAHEWRLPSMFTLMDFCLIPRIKLEKFNEICEKEASRT